MRLNVLIVVTALLFLLINEHYAIVRAQVVNPSRGNVYRRAEIVCHDKLEEWRNSSTTTTATGDQSAAPVASYRDTAGTMRGKWKPTPSSSDVVLPSFLSSAQGQFDFPSLRMVGLIADSDGEAIQNVSGTMYFWTEKTHRYSGPRLEMTGVYDRDSGEVCFVGCVPNTTMPFTVPLQNMSPTNITNHNISHTLYPAFTDSDEACIVHGQLTVARGSISSKPSVKGMLESLITNTTADGYFTSVSLEGRIMSNKNQRSLYRWDLIVRSAIFAVEAVILMWQIYHSIRSPESYFVSMLMIIVQITVVSFLSVYSVYAPIRLLIARRFKFLFSTLTLLPLLLTLTIVIFFNAVFLIVILRKRFVAKRLNVVERPKELLLGIICLIIYSITAVIVWSTHNFDTYVQVVWCWFLLPQVIANIFWDLRLKPLHWVYVAGVSLCRVSYIGFQALRPTILGFDDFTDFPHGWFWGIFFTVVFFGSYALLQQQYGGRCFLPQRWFGYKAIASSKGEADQDKLYSKDEDTTLDL